MTGPERLEVLGDLLKLLAAEIEAGDVCRSSTATRKIVEANRVLGYFDGLAVTYESADTIAARIEMEAGLVDDNGGDLLDELEAEVDAMNQARERI